MKPYTLLLLFPINLYACSGYVIGFSGLKGVFDKSAFNEYAEKQGYCSRVYSWQEVYRAREHIESLEVPYQLYGFSKGAETVSNLLKTVTKLPRYVITIGAYKTANVDFSKYGVAFNNYFDDSGRGQLSPGVFLNVPHTQMQSAVNKLIGK